MTFLSAHSRAMHGYRQGYPVVIPTFISSVHRCCSGGTKLSMPLQISVWHRIHVAMHQRYNTIMLFACAIYTTHQPMKIHVSLGKHQSRMFFIQHCLHLSDDMVFYNLSVYPARRLKKGCFARRLMAPSTLRTHVADE